VSRVGDLPVPSTPCLDGALDVGAACRELARLDVDVALVRDGGRLGVISARELRDCLLVGTPPSRIATRDAASFDLPVVHRETTVSEALRLMQGYRGRPILVDGDDGEPRLLGPNGLIAIVTSLWQATASQLERADSLAALEVAAHGVDAMVAQLHRQGARIERIAFLVGKLNSSLFDRLWSLLAPAELQRRGCLMVMGSEGRGEQIVKTDQDNALLLPDDIAFDGVEKVVASFNAALRRFGYPSCPGDIMVTNPLWRQPLQRFKQTLSRWMRSADQQGVMNLAIFMDARAISGDVDLLVQARRFMYDCLVDNDAFYARFANPAIQFPDGERWWRRWLGIGPQSPSFDLKKQGTFPIVHGVRALALQKRIDSLNTAERLQALASQGVLSEILARDLTDALLLLVGMKMKVNLRQRELGLPLHNAVRLADLATLERNQLADCLAVVRPFRRHLRRHFSLDVL
jgi:CBS domain-containing protein